MAEREQFEAWLRDKKFPVLPVWKDGKPFQNYALELMWDAWQASRRAALEEACAAIKAEDDRQHDNDYMLDSDECIQVVRALATGDTNNG